MDGFVIFVTVNTSTEVNSGSSFRTQPPLGTHGPIRTALLGFLATTTHMCKEKNSLLHAFLGNGATGNATLTALWVHDRVITLL